MNPDSNRFPISVEALQASLPHRPPMVWITRVLSANEISGICETVLDPNHPSRSPNGLRQSSLIEFMAQAFGFSHAAILKKTSDQAFLASVSQLIYCEEEIWMNFQEQLRISQSLTLTTEVSVVRVLGPITLISGEVRYQSTSLAKGNLKVFSN